MSLYIILANADNGALILLYKPIFVGSQLNQALPIGYQLNGYEIVKHLRGGGFSIVYLAHDEHGTTVAIKEYMPPAPW